eukprot:1137556-Pelagomonas_calceolata.AAC.3
MCMVSALSIALFTATDWLFHRRQAMHDTPCLACMVKEKEERKEKKRQHIFCHAGMATNPPESFQARDSSRPTAGLLLFLHFVRPVPG